MNEVQSIDCLFGTIVMLSGILFGNIKIIKNAYTSDHNFKLKQWIDLIL
jgi:hypothetical protein